MMNREALDARIRVLIGKMLDETITSSERCEFHGLNADRAAQFRRAIPERFRRLRDRRRQEFAQRGY